jgi:hypothetical protein
MAVRVNWKMVLALSALLLISKTGFFFNGMILPFCVYVLFSRNNLLYTGFTTNIATGDMKSISNLVQRPKTINHPHKLFLNFLRMIHFRVALILCERQHRFARFYSQATIPLK